MTFTTQMANFVAEMQTAAAEQLILRDKQRNLVARYVQNDFANTMIDQEVADGVPGITKQEIIDGITAFNAVLTALGDDVSGQATNLIKLKV
jgi:predicted DNA-binding protein YlxM (UPF0122 family)